MKTHISNISSVGIIARATNPGQIFIEMKDDGHPIALVRRTLCLIGGNWIGESAKSDGNPLNTFRREWREEISFERPRASTLELGLMGIDSDEIVSYQTPVNNVHITREDEQDLAELKAAVAWNCLPFGSWLNTVTREAMLSADPGSNRETFTTLTCYWGSLLNETVWTKLVRLQKKFGNLSNESITLVTSVGEIVDRGIRGAFVHEQPLQQFFRTMGLSKAKGMVITPNQTSVYAGPPLGSYDEYLEKFEVAKHP